MDTQKVDMFILSNSKFFESHQVNMIRTKLLVLDEASWVKLSTTQFKDPTIALIVSLLAGGLGIDRFMIGDTGHGIGKLLTLGGLGIWTIIDWFLIQNAAREKNIQKVKKILDQKQDV